MYEELTRKLSEIPSEADVILDTDCYNEVDDQFALSYLLSCPERIHMLAVCAAPFFNERSTSPEDGMVKSYAEIKRIVSLCRREDLLSRCFEGARAYLKDEFTPEASPACAEMIRLAREHSPAKPLYIVSIGCITNAASALLTDPAVKENCVFVWLGGHSLQWPDTREFNMRQDIAAARVAFKSGAPLVLLPCMGVVSAFTLTAPEIRYWMKGKNQLCDYLGANVLDSMKGLGEYPWSRVIWDVCAAAWLLNDNERFLSERCVRMPLPEYDGTYSKTELTPHPVAYVWYVRRDSLMNDLLARLTRMP